MAGWEMTVPYGEVTGRLGNVGGPTESGKQVLHFLCYLQP